MWPVLTALALTFGFFTPAAAQTPQRPAEAAIAAPTGVRSIENLRALARLYGYVRYFNPAPEAMHADWNRLLVDAIPGVESAGNPEALAVALERAFESAAPALVVRPTSTLGGSDAHVYNESTTGEGGRRNRSTADGVAFWRHVGVATPEASARGVYWSERLVVPSDSAMGLPSTPDEPWQVELPGGVRASFPLVVSVDLPSDPSQRSWRAPGDSSGLRLDPSERPVAIAAVIHTWSVVQHFFPYFDHVDVDWDAELTGALTSASKETGTLAVERTLLRMLAPLRDGHGGADALPYRAGATPPLQARWIEDHLVVTAVDSSVRDSLRPGDVILRIDGEPTEALLRSLDSLQSGGTFGRVRIMSVFTALWGAPGSRLTLAVRGGNDAGRVRELTLSRTGTRWPASHAQPPVSELRDGTWYVDLTRANDSVFNDALPRLSSAKGLIFDLRGYPRLSPSFLRHLTSDTLRPGTPANGEWGTPITTRPDRQGVTYRSGASWTIAPASPRFTTNVVFLTDERAISYSETLLGLVESAGLGTIVGSHTAGTNGNINSQLAPGGFRVTFTGMRVMRFDGSPLYGKGIPPDVEIRPTIAGIVAGRDEVLEKGLEVVAGLTGAAQPASLQLVGRHRISATYAFEFVPPYLYALERGQLRVLDVSNPDSVREVHTLDYPGRHAGMRYRHPFLYLIGFGYPLGVVDVSQPQQPRWLGERTGIVPAPGRSARLADDRLLVLRRENQGRVHLDVLDLVGDPADPPRIGTVDLGVSTFGESGSIAHAGDRAFVAIARPVGADAARSIVLEIEFADPAAPKLGRRWRLPPGRRFGNFEVRGDTLYALARGPDPNSNGLATFILGDDPEPPMIAFATHSMLRWAMNILLHRDVAYVTFGGTPTFATFDISDARRPRMVAAHVENERWASGLGLTLHGERLYVTGDNGPSAVFDVSVADAPRLLGRWDNDGGWLRDIVVTDSVAVAVLSGDLLVLDARDPRRMRRTGVHAGVPAYWTGGTFQYNMAAGVRGDRALVAYESIPAELLDITDPARVRVIGRFEPRGLVHSILLGGSHAYLGFRAPAEGRSPRTLERETLSSAGGIEIVDLDSVGSARPVVHPTDAAVTDLSMAGGLLAAAHPGGGVTLVDVSDPRRPRTVGAIGGDGTNGGGPPHRDARVAITPDRQLLVVLHSLVPEGTNGWADGKSALSVVSITEPTSPRTLARIELDRQGPESSLALSGRLAAVLSGMGGSITVYDLSDPERPLVVARQPRERGLNSSSIAARGDRLFVSAYEDGILVYALPESKSPR